LMQIYIYIYIYILHALVINCKFFIFNSMFLNCYDYFLALLEMSCFAYDYLRDETFLVVDHVMIKLANKPP